MEKNKKLLKLQQLYAKYAKEFAVGELVFGEGNIESGIVMIGEAPGKDEIRLGKPFVGLAGGNLKEFIDYVNLKREEIYVTNTIKYRLFKVNPKTGGKANRPAKTMEIKSSMPYLINELEILEPSLVITLGNVPLKAVTADFKITIGKVHGELITLGETRIFPLYHPASLIYNRSLIETYYSDLDKLSEILREVKK